MKAPPHFEGPHGHCQSANSQLHVLKSVRLPQLAQKTFSQTLNTLAQIVCPSLAAVLAWLGPARISFLCHCLREPEITPRNPFSVYFLPTCYRMMWPYFGLLKCRPRNLTHVSLKRNVLQRLFEKRSTYLLKIGFPVYFPFF